LQHGTSSEKADGRKCNCEHSLNYLALLYEDCYIYVLFRIVNNNPMNKVVTFGEIMLRLSTQGYQRFAQSRQFDIQFGGGEANVAISLANYGIPVEFVTRLPDNDIAQACLMELKRLSVGTRHISGGDRLGFHLETEPLPGQAR
jgi:hypothetical protein